ncbi:MAG: SIS domain-containing protein, partial [Candidatus Korarchaeota archaeon]|nr:SIS domain-containing protein [Candidatus Korarchaeota archaeon]NIU84241.1 SIS domain-containing protein [Candidatus Thorarchaeota archaeon]NIW14404.1 SIS domain-containing protein [Candidatus Thorarchaeota archaeon]NIW52473.1 SIS domain-containing protein [Candidatus Korarchaeota archaeon]
EKISSIDLSSPEDLEKVPPPKFENFMSREIHNQPYALRRALASSQEKYVNLIARMISKGEGLFLTGCGTSYHAARLGGYLFRQISDLTPSVVNAAEFRYYTLKDLEPGAVILAISQSGRTTDLLRTVRDAKMYGASIIGILNHLATPLMFASNLYLPIGVGEENAIPATKSFLGTLICLYKITLKIAERKQINRELVASTKERLKKAPQLIQKTIECTEPIIAKIASKIKKKNHIFVLGRGIDLPVALEGSLKFKEAAHIHSEGMTAGELRHGSITLLEKKFPAIFLIPQEKDAREDTYALISEANEIGGDSILITEETDIKAERVSSKVIKVPKTSKLLSPFVKTVPLQLLSYKIGTLRGITVDKPKALSKSVILEE